MKKLFSEIPYMESERLIIKRVEDQDAEALSKMTQSKAVYRYLPTFLLEQQGDDIHEVIGQLYEDCYLKKQNLILGIYLKEGMTFCGLAEYYGYKDILRKTCIGYRLIEEFWGKGIASEAVSLMIDYLYCDTDIRTITASVMKDNSASAHVLEKNGFKMLLKAIPEDWGYEKLTIASKWFREKHKNYKRINNK